MIFFSHYFTLENDAWQILLWRLNTYFFVFTSRRENAIWFSFEWKYNCCYQLKQNDWFMYKFIQLLIISSKSFIFPYPLFILKKQWFFYKIYRFYNFSFFLKKKLYLWKTNHVMFAYVIWKHTYKRICIIIRVNMIYIFILNQTVLLTWNCICDFYF